MRRRALWLIIGIVGGALVPLGLGGGLLTLALCLADGGALTTAETLSAAAMMAFGLGLGVPLVVHGVGGSQARPSTPFNPSRVWWMWFAWVFLLGLGTAVSLLSWTPALFLPAIHVFAMSLSPLAVVWMVGRAMRGMGGSWREVVLGVTGGGFLGIGGSLVGEALVALVLLWVVTTLMLVVPGGEESIIALAKELKDPAWQNDLTNLMSLLLSPVVALSLFVMLSVAVPVIEEAFKALAAGLMARWLRPHPARAFMWGVAGGAGFALVENLFSGAWGGAEGWALGAMSRFGATVMHCFTAGLVGWGWGQLWTARRPWRLLGAYAVAVIVHGLWNTAVVGTVLLGAVAWVYEGNNLWVAFAGMGILALLGVIGLLTVAFVCAMPLVARRLTAGMDVAQNRTTGPEETRAVRSLETSVS